MRPDLSRCCASLHLTCDLSSTHGIQKEVAFVIMDAARLTFEDTSPVRELQSTKLSPEQDVCSPTDQHNDFP